MNRSVLLLLAVASLIGCGGDAGPTDAQLLDKRADASETASQVAANCLSGSSAVASDFSANVDRLLNAYEESEKDSEVKQTLRNAAGTLRDCGQDDQAERLDRATD